MISQFYKIAFAALLGLSLAACGGGSSEPQHEAPQPVRSLHTGRVLAVGGNEVFDHEFPACVDNEGVENGDSVAILGVFQLGVLNSYPGRVVIVANAFELTYAELGSTLDNLTGAVLNSTVSGAEVTLVGVPGALEFNAELRNIARAYGAKFSELIPSLTCD